MLLIRSVWYVRVFWESPFCDWYMLGFCMNLQFSNDKRKIIRTVIQNFICCLNHLNAKSFRKKVLKHRPLKLCYIDVHKLSFLMLTINPKQAKLRGNSAILRLFSYYWGFVLIRQHNASVHVLFTFHYATLQVRFFKLLKEIKKLRLTILKKTFCRPNAMN